MMHLVKQPIMHIGHINSGIFQARNPVRQTPAKTALLRNPSKQPFSLKVLGPVSLAGSRQLAAYLNRWRDALLHNTLTIQVHPMLFQAHPSKERKLPVWKRKPARSSG
jgi:hypothetical protein